MIYNVNIFCPMHQKAESVIESHNHSVLPHFGRIGAALGALGLSGVMLLNPEAALAHDNVAATQTRSSMSAKEAFQACQDNIRVVAHESSETTPKSKYAVNTLKWIKHEINQGHNIIEVDGQVSSDDSFFSFHDRMLNEDTRDGSGVAHQKDSKYLNKLRTLNGDKLSNADDLIRVLQHNPKVVFQHEFKNYDGQWTNNRLALWYEKFSAAGVLGRVNVSSASQRVIKWFSTNHPEMTEIQLIGYEKRLPSLTQAKNIGATQVNVTSEAGLKNGARYLKQADRLGLRTSVRSHASGKGDDGETWLQALQNNVDQIVTQGPTKSYVCNAISRAAKLQS